MNQVKKVKCLIPFNKFGVHWQGNAFSCCPTWTKIGSVGKVDENSSIMDVWNSTKMQAIRKAIYEDKLPKVCSMEYCPYAIANKDIDLDTYECRDEHERQIINEVKQGKTVLESFPYIFDVATTGSCNLKCIMCESNDKVIPVDELLNEMMFEKILPTSLPKMRNLYLMGNGDPFFNKACRHFMQNIDTTKYPNLQIKLMTNGMMLTPKMWETVKHNRIESIHVSIDAASKETYEYIRVKGKWDVLVENLKHISRLRQENIINGFYISFVVMKSNYKELKKFVEFGIELKADLIEIQKMFGQIILKENINIIKDKKIFAELAETLNDPVFQHPSVNIELLKEYMNYTESDFEHESRYSKIKRGIKMHVKQRKIDIRKIVIKKLIKMDYSKREKELKKNNKMSSAT